MATIDLVKRLLGETLQLGNRADSFTETTPLLGAIPELDSMAVVTVIAALDESFDIDIDDGDISAEVFDTVGALADFVDRKLADA